jgi:hypothetical protein
MPTLPVWEAKITEPVIVVVAFEEGEDVPMATFLERFVG